MENTQTENVIAEQSEAFEEHGAVVAASHATEQRLSTRGRATVERLQGEYFNGCKNKARVLRRKVVAAATGVRSPGIKRASAKRGRGKAVDSAKLPSAQARALKTHACGAARRRTVDVQNAHDDYRTPARLFDKFAAEYGPFTLDVAANSENALAEAYYDVAANGLERPWTGRVWCNPPYGVTDQSAGVKQWIEKAVEATESGAAELVACLLPAYVDVAWYSYMLSKAVEIVHIRGRIQFEGPNTSNKGYAKNASVVVIFMSGPTLRARAGFTRGAVPFIGVCAAIGGSGIEWLSHQTPDFEQSVSLAESAFTDSRVTDSAHVDQTVPPDAEAEDVTDVSSRDTEEASVQPGNAAATVPVETGEESAEQAAASTGRGLLGYSLAAVAYVLGSQ